MADAVLARAVPGRVDRLSGAARFAELTASKPVGRSAHFWLHHRPHRPEAGQLSTGDASDRPVAVDDSPELARWELGFVIPKRLARRAVTRVAIRRQMRAALLRHLGGLPSGQWVVRLRSAWDPVRYRSAVSPALRDAVGQELESLMQTVSQRGGMAARRR